jgi:hypothetical protein
MKKPAEIANTRQARVNLSHHGSDEQLFGAAQQVLHRLVD